MKTSLLVSAFLFTSLSAALARPFDFNSILNAGFFGGAHNRIREFQADGDKVRELYKGGSDYLDVAMPGQGLALNGTIIELPKPDTDPYPPNFPVSWKEGRGEPVDMDNDGDMDIVYSTLLHYNDNPEDRNVRIVACRNNGDGTWARVWQMKNIASPLNSAPEVKLADFDRDGDPDLLETSNGMVIRWNDGAGNFTTTSPVLHGVYPTMPGFSDTPFCEVGDFDANGWPDIALFANIRLNANDPKFNVTGRGTIYYNQDGSNFETGTFVTNTALVVFVRTAQADIDGDGRPDLLATRRLPSLTSELLWFRNNGTGFSSGQIIHSLTNAQAVGEVAFAPGDVDEDGLPDIVVATRKAEAQWQRNTGGGVFEPMALITEGEPFPATSIGAADLDADGDVDILANAARSFITNVSPHLRGAANPVTYAGTALSGAVDLTTGDLNNDGVPDLIAADGGANRIRWYAAGAAGLTEQVFISTGSASPLSVAAGDWNRDGWTDVAWAGNNNSIRQGLSAIVSGTAWTFSDAASFTGVAGILPGDIDHDGDTDLLSWSTGGVLRIQANTGNAAWLPQAVDSAVTGINRAALGETFPGGRQEIVALGSTTLSHWLFSGSAWVKTEPLTAPAGTASRALCLGNASDTLKGPEIIYSLNANSVYVTHLTLSQPLLLATFSSPVVQLEGVDWNHDGYTDILVTTTTGVSLLSHTASAGADFETAPLVLFTAPAGRTLQDTVVLEVNRDSLPDAVTADSAGALYILSNISNAVTSTITPGISRTVSSGISVEAARVHGSYASRVPGDASVRPRRFTFSFNRAVGTPGAEVPGTPLTDEEISTLVDSVQLRVAGAGYYNHGDNTLEYLGNGQAAVEFGEWVGAGLDPENPELDYTLHLAIRGTVANGALPRFFVLTLPAAAWVPAGAAAEHTVRARSLGTSQRVLLTLRDPSPLELWREQYFGFRDAAGDVDGDYANEGDFDRDSIPNLVEYLTGRNPKVPDAAGDPAVNAFYDTGLATVVTDVRLLSSYDSRVKVTVQYSVDPTAGWGSVATRTGPGAWTGTQPYSVSSLPGSRTRYLFNRGISPSSFPKAFYRIKAEEVP